MIIKQPTPSKATRRPVRRWPEPVIGQNVSLGVGCVIYHGVVIGDDCLIGDYAVIREGTIIGNRCVVGLHASVSYECVIGDDVRIMDGARVIGKTRIGSGTLIGVGVVMSNDRHVDPKNYEYNDAFIHGPIIGDHVMVGSGANLLAGIRIGDESVIAAGALVVKDVPPRCLVKSASSVSTPLGK